MVRLVDRVVPYKLVFVRCGNVNNFEDLGLLAIHGMPHFFSLDEVESS